MKSTSFCCCYCCCCWVEKVYFSSAIFFHSFLLCVLLFQVDFVLQAFFVCATFEHVVRSFRFNSCENKFEQIVHRVYTVYIWMCTCEPSYYQKKKWYTEKRVNSFSVFFLHFLSFHASSTVSVIKTFTRLSDCIWQKYSPFFIFQHKMYFTLESTRMNMMDCIFIFCCKRHWNSF